MGEIEQTRRELATAFRWAARLNYHEAVANHFSAAVSDDGQEFLINPRGRHFSRMRASELVLIDTSKISDSGLDHGVDETAWILHAHLHKSIPNARAIMHSHMPYATTLACLAEYEFQMLDQNACRFFDRIAYDRNYSGMVLDASEGHRLSSLLTLGKDTLFLGNHGVLMTAPTVAKCFENLYYLEHAAKLQVLALSTGRPLSIISDQVAASTRQQWDDYPEAADMFMAEMMKILDQESADYIE
jgi:ribulose-5-phosphate 4-epimerase/fuculose-1-phosphate aldolase